MVDSGGEVTGGGHSTSIFSVATNVHYLIYCSNPGSTTGCPEELKGVSWEGEKD